MAIRVVAFTHKNTYSKRLAETFGTKRIKRTKSSYKYKKGDLIVNWGCGSSPHWFIDIDVSNMWVLNKPSVVANSIDKVKALNILNEADCSPIPFTNSTSIAQGWSDAGHTVFCRVNTIGLGGKGIVVTEAGQEVTSCSLYTKGIECKREYRVAVVDGKVIDVMAKAAMNKENPKYVEPHPYIQNHRNGYVFVRNSVKIPEKVMTSLHELAIKSVAALGLDFASMDILRGTDNNLYILEANTAPGLSGATSLKRYSDAFIKYYNKEKGDG